MKKSVKSPIIDKIILAQKRIYTFYYSNTPLFLDRENIEEGMVYNKDGKIITEGNTLRIDFSNDLNERMDIDASGDIIDIKNNLCNYIRNRAENKEEIVLAKKVIQEIKHSVKNFIDSGEKILYENDGNDKLIARKAF